MLCLKEVNEGDKTRFDTMVYTMFQQTVKTTFSDSNILKSLTNLLCNNK